MVYQNKGLDETLVLKLLRNYILTRTKGDNLYMELGGEAVVEPDFHEREASSQVPSNMPRISLHVGSSS